MDISMVAGFVSPIIVVACLIVGYVVKHAIPNETVNRYIPLIVAVLGIVLNIWGCMEFSLEVVVTGAISGIASTGFYELFSQLIEKGFTGTKTANIDDETVVEMSETNQDI